MTPQTEAALVTASAALLGALIGGLVTVVGWYVTKRKEEMFRKQQAALNYRQSQIEELYGPLFGLIQQARAVYDDAKKLLPTDKDGKLDLESFSHEDKRIGDHYIDSYIRPLNKQMAELVMSKMYLLDSNVLPDSFRQFMEHAAHLESISSLDRAGLNIYEKAPWVRFPLQFSKDVKESLDSLLIQYKDEIQLLQGTQAKK